MKSRFGIDEVSGVGHKWRYKKGIKWRRKMRPDWWGEKRLVRVCPHGNIHPDDIGYDIDKQDRVPRCGCILSKTVFYTYE